MLDADIWGFSLSRLLGIQGEVRGDGWQDAAARATRSAPGRIKLLSMGLLADEDQALLWRGLIVQKAVAQFIEDADWSGIDYLLIDTPPGTGDIAMTLARLLPRMGQLVVTTPTLAAQRVAARAADFARKSQHPSARRDREHERLHLRAAASATRTSVKAADDRSGRATRRPLARRDRPGARRSPMVATTANRRSCTRPTTGSSTSWPDASSPTSHRRPARRAVRLECSTLAGDAPSPSSRPSRRSRRRRAAR